jgi:hypothetical protein
MKGIASRTADPDINEFLNNQKTGRLLPDVESANDGPRTVKISAELSRDGQSGERCVRVADELV